MRRWKRAVAALLVAMIGGCAAVAEIPAAPEPAESREWFIFLETGKKTPEDKARVAEMQRGHLENFKRLFGEKKLFAAGPLRDPSGVKRGIVVVSAPDRATLDTYFQPDDYVREGYMTLNATPVRAIKPLNTEGIDPNGIEEVRILMVMRGAPVDERRLKAALEKAQFGGWYQVNSGPLSHILFSRERDDARLREWVGLGDPAQMQIWSQWLGKGVVR